MVDDGVFSISLTGTRQSPINIETDKNIIETDEALDDLKFEYVPANSTQVCKIKVFTSVGSFLQVHSWKHKKELIKLKALKRLC